MDITGGHGELRMVVHITRKATGKVETYHLIGRPQTEEQARAIEQMLAQQKERQNGSDPLDGSA